MPEGTMPMHALDDREPESDDPEPLGAKTEDPARRTGGRAVQESESESGAPKPRYRLRPVTTPVPAKAESSDEGPGAGSTSSASGAKGVGDGLGPQGRDPFLRPAAEDDDGYDPFSDRPPAPEPAFEEDPWR